MQNQYKQCVVSHLWCNADIKGRGEEGNDIQETMKEEHEKIIRSFFAFRVTGTTVANASYF